MRRNAPRAGRGDRPAAYLLRRNGRIGGAGMAQGRRKTGIAARLRADFLAGLAIVLPAGLTVMLLVWAVRLVDARVVPLIPVPLPFLHVAGAGVVIFVAVTTAVGVVTRHMIGQRAVALAEGVVARVPIARRLYVGAKQMVEAAIAKGGTSFRQTVLVEYPDRGLWQVVLLAAPVEGELSARTGEPDLVGLLVPTAPNPITGYLVFAPRREVIPLGLSVEDALKLIVSAGLVGPPGLAPQDKPRRP
jgi:uncharacterized membrane protein